MARLANPAAPTLLGACLLAGCTGDPAVAGSFNNAPDYAEVIAEHERSWTREVGATVTASGVVRLVRRAGGECVPDLDGLFSCVVEVQPRAPSFFTRRLIWTVRYRPDADGSLRPVETGRTALGFDV